MSEATTEQDTGKLDARPEKPSASNAASNIRGRARAFTIFFILLAVVGISGLLYWMHVRQFEETDDAEVEAHLNPVTSRIDGTIVQVYKDNNQTVKAGDPLVDLDPRDMQVALDQSRGQAAQARSMIAEQRPNISITQVQNSTSITTAEADVATARAREAVAAQDRVTAAASSGRVTGESEQSAAGC